MIKVILVLSLACFHHHVPLCCLLRQLCHFSLGTFIFDIKVMCKFSLLLEPPPVVQFGSVEVLGQRSSNPISELANPFLLLSPLPQIA